MGGAWIFPHQQRGRGGRHILLYLLWLVTAGPGTWAIDRWIAWEKQLARVLDSWEPWGRAFARVILAFMFSLHGYRHVFGLLSKSAGRAAVIPLAIDRLPAFVGWLEIVGGLLLLLGLFTRISAAIVCIELAAAYFVASAPRGVWPIHNGGNETLMYLVVFLFVAVYGAGALSFDALRNSKTQVGAYGAAAS